MLILTAGNVTGPGQLEKEGLANYVVWVGINHHQIWSGGVENHIRAKGAAELLRKIADAMDNQPNGPSILSPVDEAIIRVMRHPECPKCGSQKLHCEKGCTWEIA
jgi:hypothetical protein